MLRHFVINILVVLALAYFLPGVHVGGIMVAALVVIVLSLLNTFLLPIVEALALPITALTLGLFSLVINAGMVMLAAHLIDGFSVNGFIPALIFGVAFGIINSSLD